MKNVADEYKHLYLKKIIDFRYVFCIRQLILLGLVEKGLLWGGRHAFCFMTVGKGQFLSPKV